MINKKDSTKIKKIIMKSFPVIISFGISYLIVKNIESVAKGTVAFIKDDFVLNFFIVLLSLAIAVIALLYSNVEKIRESLYRVFKNREDIDIGKLEEKIASIFRELKGDTLFIFLSLVVSWVAIIVREVKEIDIMIFNINKKELCYIIEMNSIILTLYALWDIILTLFKLSEASQELSQRLFNFDISNKNK